MPYDTKARNLKDGKVRLKDNGSNEVEVKLDNGGLKFTQKPRAKIMVKDRGALDHWRDGEEQEVEVSLEMLYSTLYSDTGGSETPTPYEALLGEGAAAGWATTSGTDAHAVTLEFEVANPVTGGKKETITFTQFVVESIELAEGEEADSLTVSGRAKSLSIARAA